MQCAVVNQTIVLHEADNQVKTFAFAAAFGHVPPERAIFTHEVSSSERMLASSRLQKAQWPDTFSSSMPCEGIGAEYDPFASFTS